MRIAQCGSENISHRDPEVASSTTKFDENFATYFYETKAKTSTWKFWNVHV